MLIQKLLQNCRLSTGRRFFNQSSKCLDSKASDSTAKTSTSTSSTSSSSSVNQSVMGPRMRAPTDFDKFILVWMKKFPKGQVPARVSEEVVYQTKSKARIRVANYMMAFTAIMCVIVAYSGRKARDSGDSIQKRNLEWHRKINEEHEAKMKSNAQ